MHVTYRVYRRCAMISSFLSIVSPNKLLGKHARLHPPKKKWYREDNISYPWGLMSDCIELVACITFLENLGINLFEFVWSKYSSEPFNVNFVSDCLGWKLGEKSWDAWVTLKRRKELIVQVVDARDFSMQSVHAHVLCWHNHDCLYFYMNSAAMNRFLTYLGWSSRKLMSLNQRLSLRSQMRGKKFC